MSFHRKKQSVYFKKVNVLYCRLADYQNKPTVYSNVTLAIV